MTTIIDLKPKRLGGDIEALSIDDPENNRTFYNSKLFLVVPSQENKKYWIPGVYQLGAFYRSIPIPTPKDVTIQPGETVKIDLGIRVICMARNRACWVVRDSEDDTVENLPFCDYRVSENYSEILKSSVTRPKYEDRTMPSSHRFPHNDHYLSPIVMEMTNPSDSAYTISLGTKLFNLVAPNMHAADVWVLGPDDARVAKYFGAN